MTDGALFSLVMATYGRSEELKPALASLIEQTDRGFELIVVDQNKDERIAPLLESVRAAGISVNHVRLDVANLSLARNVGLQHANGRIVAFPDDDCWYEPDVIASVRAAFAANDAIDGIVARWCEVEKKGDRPAAPLSSVAWRRFRAGDATSFTLFFMLERLKAMGGFDPRLGTGRWFGCGEETDLILRMLGEGRRIDYLPAARIHHPHAEWPSATKAQCRRERMYGRGTGALYVKHGLPVWVAARGFVGPLTRVHRAPKLAAGLLLAGCTILGRMEGVVGWWLGSRMATVGRRQAGVRFRSVKRQRHASKQRGKGHDLQDAGLGRCSHRRPQKCAC
ncbi:MAG: glycosyltransferase [Hyphomicrobiaceae bacterium]